MLNMPCRSVLCAAWRRFLGTGFLLTFGLTAACDQRPTNMALINAQPKSAAQRNLTNFYPALQCMDALFVKAKRNRVFISANQIPDKTRSISVDARGMIITALNHMTRRSKAFVFVEQGLVGRTAGDTLALERDHEKDGRPPVPRLYVNGTISQLDKNVRDVAVSPNLSQSVDGTGVTASTASFGKENSVVTLDLHLVSFPSRVVVQGSAVSNSLTVTGKHWSSGLTGRIAQRTLGITFEIDTLESDGQAVRSLIELGLIEMLGNYTGVPFWECLSKPEVNAFDTGRAERSHIRDGDDLARLKVAQGTLFSLGYTDVQLTGKMDMHTRRALAKFQAQQGILASGALDFDTYRALEKARLAMQPKPVARRPAPPVSAPRPAVPMPVDEGGYQNLQVFVDTAF